MVRGHAVLRRLFEEKRRLNISYAEIERKSGIGERTISAWKVRANASLANVDAALGAVGLRITVEAIDD